MPPAKASGFYHTEKPLDTDKIADVQQIRNETAEVVFTHEREYKGVLFVSVAANHKTSRAPKRQKYEFRAVVLGQSHKQHGKVVLLTRPNRIFQTVVGIELKQDGGIGVGNVHWCSGLQIKWVPHVTPSTQVETCLFKEKLIQDIRVKLVKDLFNLMDKEDEWPDINWDEIEVTIDNMQRQLDATSSPNQRQQEGGKKAGNTNKARKTETEQPESGDEDWTNDSKHIVRDCKFNIDKSHSLDEDEKARVRFLMMQYMAQEPDDFEQYNQELARLLDKAFNAPFGVKILDDFTKARKVNFKLLGVQTFAGFAAWWKNRKAKSGKRSRSRSPEKRVPRNVFMWQIRNRIRNSFRYRVW